MTKFFIAVAAFLMTVSLTAQSKFNPDIQLKFNSFVELSNQKKWDQAFDLMYPKLFTQVPKQDLIDLMTSMEQDGLSFTRSNIKFKSSSEPIVEGNETFVKVEYTGNLTVKINEGSIYDAPKAISGMTEQFQTSYGKENVKWDDAGKTYTILVTISMIAIQNNTQWYLIEINKDQMVLMESLFPAPVMDALVRTE
ncbi:MAG: hypothetical protein IPP15_17735 [Saprospiraceae bacterium]|uniref:Uncharacterized protein n=1 Tax=Candidatus Opimibacter skivensis TaxID=2982028 RepID=A0A9D7SW35_9BACT|nr:hypothetical protein [Candidatus Opimibacter skivensis]